MIIRSERGTRRLAKQTITWRSTPSSSSLLHLGGWRSLFSLYAPINKNVVDIEIDLLSTTTITVLDRSAYVYKKFQSLYN